jgi:gamma-glutamylcyclotransferase (GGCT)/AIG2-like uncharacterized protein YtfP
LLLHSEERGPHTSGLAGLKIDDTLKLDYWNHQRFCAQARSIEPTCDWDLIHGGLVTFTDPQRDLPPIDRLEGFRPGGHSMYQRMMAAMLCGRTPIPAWTYWMPCVDNGTQIGTGVWHRA